jgi:hypothetical protein
VEESAAAQEKTKDILRRKEAASVLFRVGLLLL